MEFFSIHKKLELRLNCLFYSKFSLSFIAHGMKKIVRSHAKVLQGYEVGFLLVLSHLQKLVNKLCPHVRPLYAPEHLRAHLQPSLNLMTLGNSRGLAPCWIPFSAHICSTAKTHALRLCKLIPPQHTCLFSRPGITQPVPCLLCAL